MQKKIKAHNTRSTGDGKKNYRITLCLNQNIDLTLVISIYLLD